MGADFVIHRIDQVKELTYPRVDLQRHPIRLDDDRLAQRHLSAVHVPHDPSVGCALSAVDQELPPNVLHDHVPPAGVRDHDVDEHVIHLGRIVLRQYVPPTVVHLDADTASKHPATHGHIGRERSRQRSPCSERIDHGARH